MLAAQPIHATRGRWYILLLISLMYLITYLDRVNISTAAPVISKEFGFDKITMGAIFSAFVWAYALFQVPGGWLGDRLGASPHLDGDCHLLVGDDRSDRDGRQRFIVHRRSFPLRDRRSGRFSSCHACDAALVSARGTWLCARDHA